MFLLFQYKQNFIDLKMVIMDCKDNESFSYFQKLDAVHEIVNKNNPFKFQFIPNLSKFRILKNSQDI